jgi:hypothetical protein
MVAKKLELRASIMKLLTNQKDFNYEHYRNTT